MTASIVLFLASLALTIVSSIVLVEVVDRVGQRFHLPEGLVGILTALAADSPEVSAAITAIQGGRASLGFGVVIGSNIFNVAALLGLSAAIAGVVRIRRPALVLEGVVALAVTVVVSALVLRLLGPVPTVVIVLVVLAPYVWLSAHNSSRVSGLKLPGPIRSGLASAVAGVEKDERPGRTAPRASNHDIWTLVPALTAVVLGSVGMVDTSVSLGKRWGVSQILIGTLVLAALTGLPNVLGAVRLARRARGSAVVSEALNSNTLNLLVGVTLPALIVGVGAPSAQARLSVLWLLGITVVTVVLTGLRGGLRRLEGVAVIVAYLVFVVVLVVG
ncbi:MAG: sodium:calcium antiporter [Acidimicrobiales bacterium]